MYLALKKLPGGVVRFYIRQSYQDDKGRWLSRDLFDLGPDPEVWIKYEGSRSYYYDPIILETIEEMGLEVDPFALDDIFWPFLDPDIKHTIQSFKDRAGRGRRKRPWTRSQLKRLHKELHPFDKRRICFLRFYQVNIEHMVNRSLPIFNCLLNKSRDEIEQMIEFMELEMKPFFMRAYLYTIFDMPRRFAPRLSRYIPDQQDRDLIDKYLIEELCSLNSDPDYLTSGSRPQKARGLHPYLQKYLILYFDMYFKGPWLGGAKIGGQSPAYGISSTYEAHLKVIGISPREFSQMSEEELKHLFRTKAQELHPDKGGDHEQFIALKEAFQILLARKRM